MKLIINTASAHKGGSIQVAFSFLEECKDLRSCEYHVVVGKGLSKVLNKTEFPNNFRFYYLSYRPAQKVLSLKDQTKFFKELEAKVQPDCVFTTSGPAYWRPKAPHLMGYNLAHYIYPESPFFRKISRLEGLKWYLKGIIIKYFTKKDADAYVTQTDDINHRLRKWIHTSRVYTVSNTFGAQYHNLELKKNLLPSKKGNEFRFLVLSGYYAHKNLEILVPILERLRQKNIINCKFVLTLSKSELDHLIPAQLQDFIINAGIVSPKDCPQLYKECDSVFLPTLLECFSATYAEAMKMKKPIVTTDMSFAHTVCGEAALYYSPMDPEDATEKILLIMESKTLAAELTKKGLEEVKKLPTAAERAKQYLQICQNLVEDRRLSSVDNK